MWLCSGVFGRVALVAVAPDLRWLAMATLAGPGPGFGARVPDRIAA